MKSLLPMQLRQVPSGSSRAVTPSDATEAAAAATEAAKAGRASTASPPAKQLGDYPEAELSPSRSSRLSKRNGEIPRNSHNIGGGLDEEVVASDYEKRIAFIQKQHEKMLTALHREVEQLKRKNKGFMT